MFYAQKRVVVTGGASFIGSHVVDALIAAQAIVTVVDGPLVANGQFLAVARE